MKSTLPYHLMYIYYIEIGMEDNLCFVLGCIYPLKLDRGEKFNTVNFFNIPHLSFEHKLGSYHLEAKIVYFLLFINSLSKFDELVYKSLT